MNSTYSMCYELLKQIVSISVKFAKFWLRFCFYGQLGEAALLKWYDPTAFIVY